MKVTSIGDLVIRYKPSKNPLVMSITEDPLGYQPTNKSHMDLLAGIHKALPFNVWTIYSDAPAESRVKLGIYNDGDYFYVTSIGVDPN